MSSPPTIAIVDDDASFCRAIERLLRASGFDARKFSSAEEFLASPEPGSYGCLILDVQLPGISGFELFDRLAAINPSTSAVFVTALDDARVQAHVEGLKGSAFLRKLFLRTELLDAVHAQLKRHRPAS